MYTNAKRLITISVLLLVVGSSCLFSCAKDVSTISQRPPNLFDKQNGNMNGNVRAVPGQRAVPNVYIKDKAVEIVATKPENTTGSLWSSDDKRNFLFTSAGPVAVGDYINVKVDSNRSSKDGEKKSEPKEDGVTDPEIKELLASLPNLDPQDPTATSLVDTFKMRVMHNFPNGDALVEMTRASQGADQAHEMKVQAKVPYAALASGEGVKSSDLYDVNFLDNSAGEPVARESSGWEDEYTLRLSGFNEANSRLAMNLESKRQQLDDTRKRLDQRIQNLAKEKDQVTKERERLGAEKEQQKQTVESLKEKVEKQRELIQDQKDQIESIAPELKPGDANDGSEGA